MCLTREILLAVESSIRISRTCFVKHRFLIAIASNVAGEERSKDHSSLCKPILGDGYMCIGLSFEYLCTTSAGTHTETQETTCRILERPRSDLYDRISPALFLHRCCSCSRARAAAVPSSLARFSIIARERSVASDLYRRIYVARDSHDDYKHKLTHTLVISLKVQEVNEGVSLNALNAGLA